MGAHLRAWVVDRLESEDPTAPWDAHTCTAVDDRVNGQSTGELLWSENRPRRWAGAVPPCALLTALGRAR